MFERSTLCKMCPKGRFSQFQSQIDDKYERSNAGSQEDLRSDSDNINL